MAEHNVNSLLPDDALLRFRARAAQYDEQNAFFVDDFAELRELGYLAAPVPEALGGMGFSLEQLVGSQRLLAAHAPATALGINMHLVWVQVARFLNERAAHLERDSSLDWVLREAVAGEVFAFGISEAGNEAVLMDAFSRAEPRAGGGYEVTGTKIFTTLSPVWTRLGVHAKCTETGQLVFGFVRRGCGLDLDKLDRRLQPAQRTYRDEPSRGLTAGTITHPGQWNPLGMRATQSYTTKLEGVCIEPADVAARIEPFDGSDPLVLAIFSSFSILTAAIYAGIADRALELATEAAHRGQPSGDGAIKLDDPEIAARLTSAVLAHRESLDALTLLARDIDEQRDRPDWFLALAAARNRVTDEARAAVDTAMRLVGASGFQADSELARLYRDVLAGMFHPSSSRALAATVRASLR
jgi:alkylation response protein AidB-like acyl-CoA dehydrogenase